jgi:sigma-54 dependent transcriptional regulator, acetoin dehydrogenase operon transcriptional activator AcoR
LDNLRAQLEALPPGEPARARVEAQLGELLVARGEYGQALVHLAAARRATNDARLRDRVDLATGIALIRRGESERAAPHLERHLEVARERKDGEGVARALVHLGEMQRRRGDAAQAAQSLGRAREWFEAHPSDDALAAVYTSLGELALAAGDVEGAVQLARRAVELAGRALAAAEESAALITLGEACQRRDDWEGAEAAIRRAIDVAATADMPRELAEAYFAYGRLVGSGVGKLDLERAGSPATWIARAQELFRDHGALADLERVRAAFRVFGRRATDHASAHDVRAVIDELSGARQSLAQAAHQLVDGVEQHVARVESGVPPTVRERLRELADAAHEGERAVTARVEALAEAETRALGAVQSMIVERENIRTLLELCRSLNALGDYGRLLGEICKMAAQLTGADRCVVAMLEGGRLVPRASLRMPDVDTEKSWRAVMEPIVGGAGPTLVRKPKRPAGGRRAAADPATFIDDPVARLDEERAEAVADDSLIDSVRPADAVAAVQELSSKKLNSRAPLRDGGRDGQPAREVRPDARGQEPRLGHALATPLRHVETLFGALYVDKELCGGVFTAHELDLLTIFAAQAAAMLEIARVAEELRLASRSRAATLEAISDGVLSIDRKGCVTSINAVAARILGVGGGHAITLRELPDLAFLRVAVEQGEELDGRVTRIGSGEYICNARLVRSDSDDVVGAVITLTEMKRAQSLAQRIVGSPARYSFGDIIGQAPSLRRRLQLAEAAARSDSSVLITGESGTGKEVLAQAIHNASPRAAGPFVGINCSAIPRELLESELFGYEGGAFTGAKRGGHPGRFELAEGGTILLDEIGDMPIEMQAKLLRVLQEKRVHRIGGTREVELDARVIATTNRDLDEDAAKGRFRRDLLFRLKVINIELPALRDRAGDIPLIVDHYLALFAARLGKSVRAVAPSVMEALVEYPWPGNIRELENVLEAEVNLVADDARVLEQVPDGIRPRRRRRDDDDETVNLHLPARTIEENEKQMLVAALQQHRGSVPDVARQLGISRGTVYNKLRRFALDPVRFRGTP